MTHFVLIDMDGWNLGISDAEGFAYLEYHDLQEATDIANHWDNWINGMDV